MGERERGGRGGARHEEPHYSEHGDATWPWDGSGPIDGRGSEHRRGKNAPRKSERERDTMRRLTDIRIALNEALALSIGAGGQVARPKHALRSTTVKAGVPCPVLALQ